MKRTMILLLTMLILFSVCACGRKNGQAEESQSAVMTSEASWDMKAEADYAAEASEAPEEEITGEGGVMDEAPTVQQDGKIIRTLNLTMETLEFDGLIQEISARAGDFGGYVENSDITNNSYYSEGNRYGSFIVRIPADKADAYLKALGGKGTIVMQSENLEDVTLQYVDTESHILALDTEKTRLLELMEQAESLEEILQIEQRLTDIRYEMEAYESKLKVYDNRIQYTTLYIDVEEVRQISTPEEASLWEKIRDGFMDSLNGIRNGAEAVVVFILAHIPYLLLIGAVVVLIVIGVKRRKKVK